MTMKTEKINTGKRWETERETINSVSRYILGTVVQLSKCSAVLCSTTLKVSILEPSLSRNLVEQSVQLP